MSSIYVSLPARIGPAKNPNDLIIKRPFSKFIILKNAAKVKSEIEKALQRELKLVGCIEKEKVIICNDAIVEESETHEETIKLTDTVAIRKVVKVIARKYIISGRTEKEEKILSSKIVTVYDSEIEKLREPAVDVKGIADGRKKSKVEVHSWWSSEKGEFKSDVHYVNVFADLLDAAKILNADLALIKELEYLSVKTLEALRRHDDAEVEKLNELAREYAKRLLELISARREKRRQLEEERKKAIIEAFTKTGVLPPKKVSEDEIVFGDETIVRFKTVCDYGCFKVPIVEKHGKLTNLFGEDVYRQLVEFLAKA